MTHQLTRNPATPASVYRISTQFLPYVRLAPSMYKPAPESATCRSSLNARPTRRSNPYDVLHPPIAIDDQPKLSALPIRLRCRRSGGATVMRRGLEGAFAEGFGEELVGGVICVYERYVAWVSLR